MKELIWMADGVVLAIHRRQLAEHGGLEGIRDEGLLQSALYRPQNLLAYSESPPDLGSEYGHAGCTRSTGFQLLYVVQNLPYVELT